MFTGIVSSIGLIAGSVKTGQDLLLKISAPDAELGRVVIGDSIAVAGVCLTVTALSDDERPWM
jgi:riboflavin synthase